MFFILKQLEFVTNPKVSPATRQISYDKLQKRIRELLDNEQPDDVVIEYIKVS